MSGRGAIVATAELLAALKSVMPALGRGRVRIPILAGVRLAIAGGVCEVVCTDLERAMRASVPVDESGLSVPWGAIVPPAALLLKVLGAMRKDYPRVELSVQTDEMLRDDRARRVLGYDGKGRLTITGERLGESCTYRLVAWAADDYPLIQAEWLARGEGGAGR